jgi:signal transduction histidine kinase
MDLEPARMHAAGSRPMWLARLGLLALLTQSLGPAPLLPVALVCVLGLAWPARPEPSLRPRRLVLLAAFGFELTVALGAALGPEPQVASLLAVELIAAGVHGLLFESRAAPFTTVAMAVGALAAAGHGALGVSGLIAVAGAGAGAMSRWAGQVASQGSARLRAEAALRLAMQAQWLERQAVPSDDPHRLRAFHHDLNNTLQGALLASDGLVGALGKPGNPALALELASEIADELYRVSRMTRDFRPVQPRPLARARVSVEAVAAATVARCRLRFAAVTVAHTPGGALELDLVGGEDALQRVLEGLLVNACEGDGQRRAAAVQLQLESTPELLRLRVLDDGPGFPGERLLAPAEPFWTTKPSHHGLGLCTAEMLVRANGGALARTSRPEGGACVTVELPRRTSSAAA